MARRHAEFREKEARKLAASQAGVALPRGRPEEAGFARSWTDWLRREVVTALQDDDSRLIIMEEARKPRARRPHSCCVLVRGPLT